MQIIVVPSICEREVSIYQVCVNSFRDALNTGDTEVCFDCGNLNFIRPIGLTLLASMVAEFLRRKCEVYFIEPVNSRVCKYLVDQGFYEEFQIENNTLKQRHRSTSVTLRNLEVLDYSYIEEISNWMASNSKLSPENIWDLLNATLVELINNVLDHSDSPIGCYITAQAYPQEQRLLFSVIDLGDGFLKKLKTRYSDLNSNADAIEHAIKEGVTSGKHIRNRGLGLYLLSDFVRLHGTEFEIVSKDGRGVQKRGEDLSKNSMSFTFPGTCVNLILPGVWPG